MKIKIYLLLAISFISLGKIKAQDPELSEQFKKMNTFLYQINEFYVDSVKASDLVQKVIKQTLSDLDPHSVYIPAEELEKMNEPLKGNFEGIGIQFNILKDTIVVVSPIAGGPSEKLGIQAGDKIVEIEGENVGGIGITNSDVADKLRGNKGTIVNVGIKRNGAKKLIHFDIERDKIPIYSVDAGFMLDDETGYIKVNRFAANTLSEFRAQLNELKESGVKNLVLDLQGNGGGYLNTAKQLADEFLEEDELIVYTEGRSFPKENSYASSVGEWEKGKLIVLIDEGSASASEIVSGAVQDHDRGIIIGRRSFGKGLVQKPFMLPDGSAMRLTISRYYTPSGRCIQKEYGDDLKEYYSEKYERFKSGELFSADSISFPDSLKYFTTGKRIVYGGGGIMPDIFVGLDTNGTSDFFSDLVRKGIMNNYCLEFVNSNREDLAKEFTNVKDFKNKFDWEGKYLAEFKKYVAKEELDWNEEEYQKSKNAINLRAKALIARNIFDSEAFYYVISDLNDALQEALRVLNANEYKKTLLATKS